MNAALQALAASDQFSDWVIGLVRQLHLLRLVFRLRRHYRHKQASLSALDRLTLRTLGTLPLTSTGTRFFLDLLRVLLLTMRPHVHARLSLPAALTGSATTHHLDDFATFFASRQSASLAAVLQDPTQALLHQPALNLVVLRNLLTRGEQVIDVVAASAPPAAEVSAASSPEPVLHVGPSWWSRFWAWVGWRGSTASAANVDADEDRGDVAPVDEMQDFDDDDEEDVAMGWHDCPVSPHDDLLDWFSREVTSTSWLASDTANGEAASLLDRQQQDSHEFTSLLLTWLTALSTRLLTVHQHLSRHFVHIVLPMQMVVPRVFLVAPERPSSSSIDLLQQALLVRTPDLIP
jgi:hypothetical protein